jgi:hypothetical protein
MAFWRFIANRQINAGGKQLSHPHPPIDGRLPTKISDWTALENKFPSDSLAITKA